jgi:hypothetical protein
MIDPGEDTSGFSNAMVGSSHAATTSPQAVAEGLAMYVIRDSQESQHGRFLNGGEPLGRDVGIWGPALRPDGALTKTN